MSGRRLLGTTRSSMIAVTVAIALAVLLLATGGNWLRSLRAFFLQPLSNRYYLGNMLSYSGYLLVAALGIVVGFRGGMFNLGGEGQIFVGAFGGTIIALQMPHSSGPVIATVLLVSATAIGAGMAALSGLLRKSFRAPELITSYLLSAALIPVVEYFITGPAKDPDRNLLATRTIPESAWLPRLLLPSELSLAAPLALLLVAMVFLFLFRSVRGYELRLFGLNEEFALYSGAHEGALTTGTMALSGALHGLAGGLMIAGTYHAAISGFTGGIGWNAIAVALVGRLHPVGALAAALLFGYLDAGSKAAMLHTDFTFELGTIIQGTILLLVTATAFARSRR